MMFLRIYRVLLLTCLLLFSIGSATESVDSTQGQTVHETPFKFGDPSIILNDDEISKIEFMAYMLGVYGMPIDEVPTKEEAMEMAEGYVLQKEYAKRALAQGLDKTERYREEMKMYQTSLLANMYLEGQRSSMDIDDALLQELYDDMISKIEVTTEYLLSQILVKDKEDADLVLQKISSGEMTFVEAVQEYSIDEFTAKNNGVLDGWFSEKTLGDDVSKALSKVDENDYSDSPVKTDAGYQIFFVHGKRTTPIVTFEEVEPQLKQQAVYKKMMEQIKSDREKLQYSIHSAD